MNNAEIVSMIDSAFSLASERFDKQVENHLFPGMFNEPEYAWLRIKAAFELNNSLLKTAIKDILEKALCD